jgi:hypothetical protein
MPDRLKSNGSHVRDNGSSLRRIAERDWRDEVGIPSVHIAPFSCHGLWRWRNFSASCQCCISITAWARLDPTLGSEDSTEGGSVHMQAIGVLNEAELFEPIHKEAHS